MSKFVKPEISSILGLLDAHLRYENENGPPRGHQKYHPSAWGGCLRLMQYQRYQQRGYLSVEGEKFEGKQLRVFDQGHTMHDRWAEYAEDMGILRGYWNCKNTLCMAFDQSGNLDAQIAKEIADSGYKKMRPRVYGKDNIIGCFKPEKCKCGCSKFEYEEVDIIDEELNFSGHCDMIFDFSRIKPEKYEGIKKTFKFDDLPKNPIVVDMKTINEFGYKKLISQGPSLKYMIQLTIYANVLPVDYGILIYQNKNTAETAVYQIDKNSDTVYDKIKKQAKAMNEMVQKKMLPPPRYEKDSYDCDGCSFKKICHASKVWDDPKIEQKKKDFYGN